MVFQQKAQRVRRHFEAQREDDAVRTGHQRPTRLPESNV